jgi:hypothetical protein
LQKEECRLLYVFLKSNQSTVSCSSFLWLDRLGVGMALICAVHCLLTPLLIVLLPIIASTFWVNSEFHLWMLIAVVPLTTFSFFMGCKKHHDITLVVLAVLGITLLFCGVLFGCSTCVGGHQFPSLSDFSHFPHGFESVFTTLGGSLLVIAHFRNYRLCRKSECEHNH